MSEKKRNLVEPNPPQQIKQSKKFFQDILVVLIIAFAILATLAKQIPYFPIDLAITHLVQHITFPGFNPLMLFLTAAGNTEWAIISIIIISIFFLTFGKNLHTIFFISSVGGAYLISVIFKLLVARPRPDPNLIFQLHEYYKNDSFPSGHVLFYMGCYGFLFYFFMTHLKAGKLKFIILTNLLLLLVGIGFSRIYVGAHWFSDTLGAYLIGTVWLYLIINILNRYGKKLGKKEEL